MVLDPTMLHPMVAHGYVLWFLGPGISIHGFLVPNAVTWHGGLFLSGFFV